MVGSSGIGEKQSKGKVHTTSDETPPRERDVRPIFQEVSKLDDKELTDSQRFDKFAYKDLEQNKRLSMQLDGKRSYKMGRDGDKVTKVRFFVCALGLVALAMSQMSRMVMNVTITQMVEEDSTSHSSDADQISVDGSCPWPEKEQKAPDSEVCPSNESPDAEPADTLDMTEPIEDGGKSGEAVANNGIEASEIETTKPVKSNDKDEHSDPFIPNNDNEDPLLDDEIGDQLQDESQPPSNPTSNSTVPPTPMHSYPRYKWTNQQRNTLLGGFFYSYFVFMIFGGRMAEIYGAKYVLMLSVAGSAIINLATPWMADTSYPLLVASRVAMGVIQAGVFPGMYALFSKWLTMTEASIFAPLIKMNLRLGMALGSMIPGLISGWPNVFYLTGFLSVVWSLLWWFIATSDPADNSWVSGGELAQINRKKQITREQNQAIELSTRIDMKKGSLNGTKQQVSNGQASSVAEQKPAKKKTPWLGIITAPSVLALIIVKLTFNFALDFLSIELPSYLKYVHHASKTRISAITSNMFLMQVFLIVFVGWLAKIAVQRRPLGMGKTGVRKLFQGTASFGMCFAYMLLTLNDCNMTYVTISLLITSFLSMFAAGGETMLPYDLSEEYPATIMAIANSVANLSASIVTTMATLVLGDQAGSFVRWNILLYIIAGTNLLGGLSFCFLVKAEPIKFDKKQARSADLEAPNSVTQ